MLKWLLIIVFFLVFVLSIDISAEAPPPRVDFPSTSDTCANQGYTQIVGATQQCNCTSSSCWDSGQSPSPTGDYFMHFGSFSGNDPYIQAFTSILYGCPNCAEAKGGHTYIKMWVNAVGPPASPNYTEFFNIVNFLTPGPMRILVGYAGSGPGVKIEVNDGGGASDWVSTTCTDFLTVSTWEEWLIHLNLNKRPQEATVYNYATEELCTVTAPGNDIAAPPWGWRFTAPTSSGISKFSTAHVRVYGYDPDVNWGLLVSDSKED